MSADRVLGASNPGAAPPDQPLGEHHAVDDLRRELSRAAERVADYRESLPGRSDQGTYGLVFAGAKLKFPFGLVIRGEYQWITMPSDVLLPLDNRYLLAAGLSF